MGNQFDDFIASLLHQAGLQQGAQAVAQHEQLVQRAAEPVLPDARDRMALQLDKAAIGGLGNNPGASAFGNGLDRGRQAVRHAQAPMGLDIGPATIAPQDAKTTLGPRGRNLPPAATQPASFLDDATAKAKHDHFWRGAPVGDTMWFAGMHPDLFPQGVSERQGYETYDKSREGQGDWNIQGDPAAVPAIDAKLAERGRGPSGLNKRGEPLPRNRFEGQPVEAGRESDTLAARGLDTPPEYITSGDADMYRQLFESQPGKYPENYAVDHGSKDIKAYAPDPYPNVKRGSDINDPMDLVTRESVNRDDDVSQTGWMPGDFDGMSIGAAAAIIADQLRAHRIRRLREADPEYLDTLPKY